MCLSPRRGPVWSCVLTVKGCLIWWLGEVDLSVLWEKSHSFIGWFRKLCLVCPRRIWMWISVQWLQDSLVLTKWRFDWLKKTGRRSEVGGMVSFRLSVFWVLSIIFIPSCTSDFGYQDRSAKYTFLVHIRTGLLLGMPQRCHSRRTASPSPAGTERLMVAGKRSHRDTRGPTSETGGSRSTGKKNESLTWEGTKEKFLNISSEDLWCLQKT